MEEEKLSQAKSSSGGKKFPTWIIVVIVVVLVLLGGAYYGANLVKNRIASSLPANIYTKDSTVKLKTGNLETIASDKEVPWPSGIPQDVPKFQGGKIKAVSHEKTTGVWVITIGDTTQLEFNNYKTYLTNANWKAEDSVNVLVNMAAFKKGENQLSLIFDPSSNSIIISLSSAK